MNLTPPVPALGENTLKTLLIIDDDVHFAAALALGLETHGYRTLHAADAANGWKLAHAHLPDLILSDIEMPGKDGRRLLQDLRADPALADRQFILMTGKTSFGGQRAAMDLGADDFLAKPFALGDLLRCVSARLKRAELSPRLDEGTVERLGATLRTLLPGEFFKPLACILGLSELLQAEVETLRPEEIRQDLRSIHKAGQQLQRTLRNYLLLLEIEGSGAARTGSVLEAEAVAEALEVGAQAACERHDRRSDVSLDLRADRVWARPGDLSTLTEELVDNALKFSRRGTPVTVMAWRDGSVIQLVVGDGGRGLSPPQVQSLMSASWRRRGANDIQGLGLVLVRRLTESLRGVFRLESRDGQGTSVYITLPIASE